MNRTIISIEVQDEGDKEATIIVTGERNNQLLFEEQFAYSDKEKHSLRLHLLKERFMNKSLVGKKTLAVMSISKLLQDITKRSEFVGVPDYREKSQKPLTIEEYKECCKKWFPNSTNEVLERDIQLIKTLPIGTIIRLPEMENCPIGSFVICE